MSIKIASMNFGDCDTILHNTPNGMKNIAEVLGPNGEVYWTSTKELTGVPPLSIKSNGTPLLDYLISGNMSQSGTPTPDSPIMPEGCGERTGNLVNVASSNCIAYSDYNRFTIDNSSIDITGNALFGFIVKCDSDTVYSVSCIRTGYNVDMRIREYSNLPSEWSTDFITQSVNRSASAGSSATFTTTATTTHLLVCFYGSNTSHISNIMLNAGSTALPYEPYGIKIPISCGGTTTPVYLGEVQTTRKIRKLVLDGTENWVSDGGFYHTRVNSLDFRNTTNGLMCSHLPVILRDDFNRQPSAFWGRTQAGDVCLCISNAITTLNAFKSYLQQQYAAGTPVTIWYVLATEETGIVNEPIRKIGDYADTVSYEQAGVQIPTNRGNTVIDVETTLKPSQMYIKYK